MSTGRVAAFPLGAALTRGALEADLHGATASLRGAEPVSWVPELNGWLVTRRDLIVEVLDDSARFTVEDPRFAVGQVLGPNMLSLDGEEHRRHRSPFEDRFKMSSVRARLADVVDHHAGTIAAALAPDGAAELRARFAAPLAVHVVREALGLVGVDTVTLLSWYDEIVAAVSKASDGEVQAHVRPSVVDDLGDRVSATIDEGSSLLAAAAGPLSSDEVISNAGVLLFGGIETSETMTANVLFHLLSHPTALEDVRADPDLVVRAIDESLRLEPPVIQLDRFATADAELAGVTIKRGDFVMLSVAGANRDPEFYPDPDRFDVHRPNARTHLAFARGPHVCLGMHLARVEARAAVAAVFRWLPGLRLDGPVEMTGSVFRKPSQVPAAWEASVLS